MKISLIALAGAMLSLICGASVAHADATTKTSTTYREAFGDTGVGDNLVSQTSNGNVRAQSSGGVIYTHDGSCANPASCPVTTVVSSRAYADLSTGALGAEAFSQPGYSNASALAEWQENVRFIVPSPIEAYDIPFTFGVDGQAFPDDYHLLMADWGIGILALDSNGHTVGTWEADGSVEGISSFGAGAINQNQETNIGMVSDFAHSETYNPNTFDVTANISGVFHGSTAIYSYKIVSLLAANGGAAFYHTALFNLSLPSDVQMVSDSGQFLTAVPEPATWALMILGFGGVGASLRHRRLVAA